MQQISIHELVAAMNAGGIEARVVEQSTVDQPMLNGVTIDQSLRENWVDHLIQGQFQEPIEPPARRLATIRRIADLVAIDGADFIEMAWVDGWQCVVKKGEFQVGDLCVYFEIDSVLPVRPEFEFLRKDCYIQKDWLALGEGFRLKTRKFKKQISQGLALRVYDVLKNWKGIWNEGDDVTETLSVQKYDPPVHIQGNQGGKPKGNFPSFLRKTDQERIQNCYRTFETKFKDEPFEKSLKLDGCSMTMYQYNGMFGVCSRNQELKLWEIQPVEDELGFSEDTKVLANPGNVFCDMAIKYEGKIPEGFAVQGELMGPGLPMATKHRDNREGFKDYCFFAYNIWDINKQEYLDAGLRVEKLEDWGIEPVPTEHVEYPFRRTLPELLEDANNAKSINNPIAEGYVYKSLNYPSISFKVISNKFLLQIGE